MPSSTAYTRLNLHTYRVGIWSWMLDTHTHHIDSLWVNSLRDDPSLVRDVLHKLIQGSSLHLLVLEVTQWVEVEVKDDTTLL